MREVTIIGAGLSGLTAAITCADAGVKVRLLEAHDALGGRARTSEGPHKANLGHHAAFKDGPMWRWLSEHELLPPTATPPLSGARFRVDGALRRTPPLATMGPVLRLRGRRAPVEKSFSEWAGEHVDERTTQLLSAAAGVYAYHHNPGELSAAFIWERTRRALLDLPTPVRYFTGGWGNLVVALETRARALGVEIERGHRVSELPDGVVVVATEFKQAQELLGEALAWTGGGAVCLDVAITSQRGDPFVVSDLDEGGWITRESGADPTLAPKGEELLQGHIGIRPEESTEGAARRLEQLFDLSFSGWRERLTWKRRHVMVGRTGALDLPGTTWRDRPAIDRGDGVFLIGDMVAAPGLLAEVAWASAIEGANGALELLQATQPALRSVA